MVGFSFYQLSTFAVICYFDFSLTFFLMSIRVDLTFSSFSICNFNLLNFFSLIAELAECSPIIIQNSSNPASRKKFGCTTIQGATFNMHGQLYCGHANTTALSSSPVVSALSSELDNPGSSPGQGKALCP